MVLMGASSGIGREAAKRFAARGAKVVVSARGVEGVDSLVAEIRGAGGTATAVAADVADPAAVDAVAARAVSEYGRLDSCVHLAAVGFVGDVRGHDDRRVPKRRRGQPHGTSPWHQGRATAP